MRLQKLKRILTTCQPSEENAFTSVASVSGCTRMMPLVDGSSLYYLTDINKTMRKS
jgi:hypothetical protein